MSTEQNTRAYRAEILHFLADPAEVGEKESFQYFSDGILVVSNGKVDALGHASEILRTLPQDVEIRHFADSLIIPGLVDCHVHYPQMEMVAAFGDQLLEWLQNYTFPTERQFSDPEKARRIAELFLDELLRNGTTTALVFATVHKESVDAFFSAAQGRNLRMICGKVLMDRNAPDYILDTPQSGYRDSKELIERWHGKGRQRYAITPRFAPTSTPEQLAKAAQLMKEYPDVYLHTHLAENSGEVEWVAKLFPDAEGYLDVYDRHGLLSGRSVFAHCIHLTDNEFSRLNETGSGIAFCPSSNLFLGSGLFNLSKAQAYGVKVGLGTDVGAGTSFSILQTINEAYKVQQLQQHKLSTLKALYLATLGGARTLDLHDVIGNFQPGKEADFVVLDYKATPLLSLRQEHCSHIYQKLFSLVMLADDRAVKEVYAMGRKVHERSA